MDDPIAFFKPKVLATFLATLVLSVSLSAGNAQSPIQHPEYDLWSDPPPETKLWDLESLTPMHDQRNARHRAFIQNGLPVEYRARKSPYPVASGVIKKGGKLYGQHCLACHGPRGLGDGAAGKDLAPSPALLAYLAKEPEAADGFLLWTISEGGAAFGSDMPAYKDSLSDQEIWQLVAFLRAGLPKIEP